VAEFIDLLAGSAEHQHHEKRDRKDRSDVKSKRQPGGELLDSHRLIEIGERMDRLGGVEKNFQRPSQHHDAEDEDIVSLHTTPDRFESADFERGQNQILADEPPPLAVEDFRALRHHGNEEMGFQHADATAKGIVEPVTPRLDPEHDPDEHQIEKEYDVRDIPERKSKADDSRARGNCPGRGDIQPLPPNHDPPQLATVKVREGVDIAGVFEVRVDVGSRGGGIGAVWHGSGASVLGDELVAGFFQALPLAHGQAGDSGTGDFVEDRIDRTMQILLLGFGNRCAVRARR